MTFTETRSEITQTAGRERGRAKEGVKGFVYTVRLPEVCTAVKL